MSYLRHGIRKVGYIMWPSEPTLNMSITINSLDNGGIVIFNLHLLASLQLQGNCAAGLNVFGDVVAVYQIPTVLDLYAIYQK